MVFTASLLLEKALDGIPPSFCGRQVVVPNTQAVAVAKSD